MHVSLHRTAVSLHAKVGPYQDDVRGRQRGDELRGLGVVCVRREGYRIHAHAQRHLQHMPDIFRRRP